MAKTIYTTRKGEKVALRPSDVKSYVMKVRGWTSQEYEKQYDKLRNRLRGYEAYQRQAGIDVNVQSPAHILYYESKSMKKYGAAYEQSNEMKRLLSFPSISTGKALQKTLEDEKKLEKLNSLYEATTDEQFKGFIDANDTAKRIAESISNPVKREQALKDFANKINADISATKAAEKSGQLGNIPIGQAVGSDDAIDFDISKYLDDEEDLEEFAEEIF